MRVRHCDRQDNLCIRMDLRTQLTMPIAKYKNVREAVIAGLGGLKADDPAMLLSKHGELMELNVVAAFVLEMLDGHHSQKDMVSALIENFKVDARTASADLVELMEEFAKLGVLA